MSTRRGVSVGHYNNIILLFSRRRTRDRPRTCGGVREIQAARTVVVTVRIDGKLRAKREEIPSGTRNADVPSSSVRR